ncbi:MAG TPA: hypothetical protein PKD72_04490 [Gemmatales bacterium]|nr:hypothetical protein [Gemmatales bacterium]
MRWILLLLVVVACAGAYAGYNQFYAAVFKGIDSTEALLDLEAKTLLRDPANAFQFIRTGTADPSYNCHGWTFRFGKRSVGIDEVEQWLNSSRYKALAEKSRPRPGDIVIYYRGDDICHSGVIQAIGFNGMIFVESKWGTLGRFIHSIHAPKIASRFTIYRRQFSNPSRSDSVTPKKNMSNSLEHQSSDNADGK